MIFYFRGYEIFNYDPKRGHKQITQGRIHDVIPAFDFCSMTSEDYKLLGEFFTKVHKHIEGELTDDELVDIEVY